MKLVDLTGQRFGRLTVLRRYEKNSSQGKPLWLCECDCGNETVAAGYSLKSGNTKSCGCYKTEHPGHTKHSGCGTRLYRIYKNIKQRCYNAKSPIYRYYGARGIVMCDEWENSFEAFRDWAYSNGYRDTDKRSEYTIDRIDVTGNYCPDNCRWVSQKVQTRNTQRTRYATCNGVTKSIGEWAEEWGVPYNTVYFKARRNNWTLSAP